MDSSSGVDIRITGWKHVKILKTRISRTLGERYIFEINISVPVEKSVAEIPEGIETAAFSVAV